MFTLAAFAAFMLISPGFCFAFGIRFRSKYDLRIESENVTTQLVGLVVLAIVIQIFTVPFYILITDFLGIPFGSYFPNSEEAIKVSLFKGENFNYGHWGIYAGYVLFTYIISYSLGRWLIAKIECGCIETSLFHGPLYDLIVKRPAYIPCTIITKVTNEKLSLMYRGHLKHITYDAKHKIKYIVLSHVDKFALKLEDDKVSTADTKTDVSYLKDKDKIEFLYIDGAEIGNILFSEYPLKKPNQEELDILKK